MKHYLAIKKEQTPDRHNVHNSQKCDPVQKKPDVRVLIPYDSADVNSRKD